MDRQTDNKLTDIQRQGYGNLNMTETSQLTLNLLMSSVDKICNHSGSRSGRQIVGTDLDPI